MIVITRQIKAARSLLGWEQHQLALQSRVAISTIRRLEGSKSPIHVSCQTISRIQLACESAGIAFIGNPEPGVQLKPQSIGAAEALQPVIIDNMKLGDRSI